MKKLLLALSILFGAVDAYAGTCEERIGKVFTANQRVQLCKSFGSAVNNSMIPSADNTYDVGSLTFGWRTGYFKTSVITPLVSHATSLGLGIAGTSEMNITDDVIKLTGTTPFFGKTSAAGNLTIGGGIANAAASGSRVVIESATAAGTGDLTLSTSDGANADAFVDLNGAASDFTVRNLSSATLFNITQAGLTTLSGAAGAGDLAFTNSGNTVAIQEATAGAKCMGTATANGTTAVTVSTTCATTGSRIYLSRSTAPSGTAICWWDTLVNGVSFNLDCNAAETGVFDWFIIHEAA